MNDALTRTNVERSSSLVSSRIPYGEIRAAPSNYELSPIETIRDSKLFSNSLCLSLSLSRVELISSLFYQSPLCHATLDVLYICNSSLQGSTQESISRSRNNDTNCQKETASASFPFIADIISRSSVNPEVDPNEKRTLVSVRRKRRKEQSCVEGGGRGGRGGGASFCQ